MRILSFGEILWDNINGACHIGGAPFNLAAHFCRMGGRASLLSCVGRDDLGGKALEKCRELGIDASLVRVHPSLPTGTVDVALDAAGVPDFTIRGDAAWDDIALDGRGSREISGMKPDALCFGTLALRSASNRDTLKKIVAAARASQVFYDVNLRQEYFTRERIEGSLEACSILKCNDDEAAALSKLLFGRAYAPREFSGMIAGMYDIRVVCVTMGARGAAVYHYGAFLELPGIDVEVADTVGAGDAFSAAFLRSFLAGWDARRSAELAMRVGSFVASRPGAVPEYSDELKEEIARL